MHPSRSPPVATIYCAQHVARAARESGGGIAAGDVDYASGPFALGDPLYVIVRGPDGGQRLFAVAEARCDGARFGPAGPDRDAGTAVVHSEAWALR